VTILELGKFYPPHHGGIETLLRSWCHGFVQRGARVDCVVANDTARTVHEYVEGVSVHRLCSFGTAFSTSLCPSYCSSTRRFPADIWHAHFPNPLADFACVRGDPKVPLVVSYHSDVIRQSRLMRFYSPLMRRLLQRATRIVVATPPQLEHSTWLGPYREKCEIIPFGIDWKRFEATVEIKRRSAELRKAANDLPILLNIGRLVGYKGQRYLIEAAKEFNAAVWFVGTGPLETELKAQANSLGMANRVRFYGAVDDADLPAMIHACDVFVLPSVTPNEAFGIVQLEAMACARPVISCDLASGVPFVNQNGITGIVVPPANVKKLAEGIGRLLGDPAIRERMGEAGRCRAQQEFDENVMIDRYWNLFERLLAARPA